MKKILSATALFSLVVWGCTVVSGMLPAQDTKEDARKQPGAAGQTLTDETLNQMLDNMGLEPKKLSKGNLVAIKQDTWTINIQVVLSANKEKLGLNANLGKVEDPASVTANQWMDLLISNGEIEPSTFYYDKEQKKLYLHRVCDNRGMTPAILRKEIDTFARMIPKTEALWKFTK